jgi:hypothetical protein
MNSISTTTFFQTHETFRTCRLTLYIHSTSWRRSLTFIKGKVALVDQSNGLQHRRAQLVACLGDRQRKALGVGFLLFTWASWVYWHRMG